MSPLQKKKILISCVFFLRCRVKKLKVFILIGLIIHISANKFDNKIDLSV